MEILSFSIPTFNDSQFLKNNLENLTTQLIDQQMTNIIIYVVDNNSTDNTYAIVSELKKIYTNIVYVKRGHNYGMENNIEFAMKMASSQYVWLLGSDDSVTICFKDLLNELKINNPDICTFKLDNRNCTETILSNSFSVLSNLLYELGWLSDIIIKRDIVDSLNFKRYEGTYINFLAAIMDYISVNDITVFVKNNNNNIYHINNGKVSYADSILEAYFINRVNFIMSLPPILSIQEKMLILNQGNFKRKLNTIILLLSFREKGVINYNYYRSHKIYFKLCKLRFLGFFISVTPRIVLRVIKRCLKYV